MTPRSPRVGATLDPAQLIGSHHFDLPTADPVLITVYGLVLDCPRCGQATSTLVAFIPSGDPNWDRRQIVLCNTDASLAVADTALPEITRIVNTVGRPAYDRDQPPTLVNGCFHCDSPITGDDLAEEVRHDYLDGLVDLGRADVPRRWLDTALLGAGTFTNHGDIPGPSVVPEILTAILEPTVIRGRT